MIEIQGFEGLYSIDESGNVFSILTNRFLKHSKDGWGYIKVTLFKNKKRHYFTVHRLVAMVFIPNPEEKSQVNHIDGNKENNKVSNLEWVTSSENILHSYRSNKRKPVISAGASNGHCRLTERQVIEIRDKASKQMTYLELSKIYNVSGAHISDIVNRKKWKHI